MRASMLEFIFNCGLYLNDDAVIKKSLEAIYTESENWNMKYFNNWHGNFKQWFHDLNMRVTEHNEFISLIASNKLDKKLQKLPQPELVK